MNEYSFIPWPSRTAPQMSDLKEISAQDDKRARLLDAALDLFETRGFDGVAVPEIAAKAGVAVGTVYRYFAGKEALVNALFRHWKGIYHEVVGAPVPPRLNARQEFGLYWQRMMLFARTYPKAIRFLDLQQHAAYLDEQSREMAQGFRIAAADFARRARAAGAIREIDPRLIVALMWGASAGLVKFTGSDGLTLDGPAIADMEDALWRAIKS